MKYKSSNIHLYVTLEEYELYQIVDAVILKCTKDKAALHLLGELLKIAELSSNANSIYLSYWKEANEKRDELLNEL